MATKTQAIILHAMTLITIITVAWLLVSCLDHYITKKCENLDTSGAYIEN